MMLRSRYAVVLDLPAAALPGGSILTPLSRHLTRSSAARRVPDHLDQPAVAAAIADEGAAVYVARLNRGGWIIRPDGEAC